MKINGINNQSLEGDGFILSTWDPIAAKELSFVQSMKEGHRKSFEYWASREQAILERITEVA